MVTVLVFQDQVQRIHQVVLINLATFVIDVQISAKFVVKLYTTVLIHFICQGREVEKVVAVNEGKHVVSLRQLSTDRGVKVRNLKISFKL